MEGWVTSFSVNRVSHESPGKIIGLQLVSEGRKALC